MRVYAGRDPVTGRSRYLTAAARTEDRAELERARLLAEAGAQPVHNGTVAQLLDKYMEVMQPELELTTRVTYGGYVRRCIVPAIGGIPLRKVRGPVLDSLYARLRRCGNPLCTGRPFTEHRNVPELSVDRRLARPAHDQLADGLRAAITLGQLQPGEELPPLRDVAEGQRVPLSTLKRAVSMLAAEKLLVRRPGRLVAVGPTWSLQPPPLGREQWSTTAAVPGAGATCASRCSRELSGRFTASSRRRSLRLSGGSG